MNNSGLFKIQLNDLRQAKQIYETVRKRKSILFACVWPNSKERYIHKYTVCCANILMVMYSPFIPL